MKLFIFFFLVLISAVSLAQHSPHKDYPELAGLQKKKAALEFMVVGDWGRNGEYYQKDVAGIMAKAARTMGTDFIVSTGDNFYPEGVISVQDPLWKSSFEDVYTAHVLQVRWYPVLGNHDYGGDPQAQIDYSRISRRWNMPSRYHSRVEYTGDGAKVLLVFLDTSPFEKGYHGSRDDLFRSNIRSQDTARQRKWLDSTLRSSDAPWKIVFGHHPLYTSGPRKGRQNDVAAALQPTLESAGADLYIAGHEHILEHDVLTPRLQHIISGAGCQVTPSTGNPLTRFVASQAGFITCSVNREECWVQFINHEGKVIYTTSIRKNG